MAWSIVNLILSLNSDLLPRSIGYSLWLFLSALFVVTITQCFSTIQDLRWGVSWYLTAFGFSALFGFFQLIQALLGFSPFLIRQFWFPGVPRIHSFSYEPSYFATYLIIGWTYVDYLIETKSRLFHPAFLRALFWVLTGGLIISTSRMGLVFMMLWLLRHLCLTWRRGARHAVIRLGQFLGIFLLLWVLIMVYVGPENSRFLLSGIGFLGDTDHSVSQRWDGAMATLGIFLDSPLLGVGLGGVGPRLARLSHQEFDWTEKTEGICVTAEILAGTGIIGAGLFFLYVLQLFRFAGQAETGEQGELMKLYRGALYSLVMGFLMLQFNQNILRPSFWLHIAFVSAIIENIRTSGGRGAFLIPAAVVFPSAADQSGEKPKTESLGSYKQEDGKKEQ